MKDFGLKIKEFWQLISELPKKVTIPAGLGLATSLGLLGWVFLKYPATTSLFLIFAFFMALADFGLDK